MPVVDSEPMAVQAHPCQPSVFQAFHQPGGSLPLLVELLDVPPAAVLLLPPLLEELLLLEEVPPLVDELPPRFVDALLVLDVPPAPVEVEPPLFVEVLLDDEDDEVPPWLELPPLAVELELDEELVLLLPPWLAAVEDELLPPWLDELLVELELLELLLPPLELLLAAEHLPALHSGVEPLQTTPHWPQWLGFMVTSVHWSVPLIMHAC